MTIAEPTRFADETAGSLAAALAARRISALEATDAAIAAIEAGDGPINAVVVRDFDRARDAARAADARLARGESAPLLGVPMTVKEAHNVAGLPTTWGLEAFKAFVPDADSVGVARLKAAGAVILGKTNVPPMLSDWQSNNPVYGRTNNPHDLARSPGGSSGGSAAALAAGFVPLEFGSDIGGSIRVPSHFCGTYGHKPSFDLVPQRGHTPPGTDGDGTHLGVIGPMARSAADLALALDVLAGPAGLEAKGYRVDLPAPRATRLADFRVLILDSHPLAGVDGEIVAALNDLAGKLEAAGASVARESGRLPDLEAAHGTYLSILMTVMSRGAPQPRDPPVSAHQFMDMLDRQATVRRQWERLFEAFDVVLAPTLGVAAFPHIGPDVAWEARALTIDGRQTPFGAQLAWPGMAILANLPSTAFPAGRTREGLPIGLQAMGPYLEDRTTIAFAEAVERELS
ncbi:MAG TPA: amidase family protein [Caulobacteraceae bacterium]|nr:amidase family protein [Caulobacteraceae bacterium]